MDLLGKLFGYQALIESDYHVLFAGHQAVGKSTLLAALQDVCKSPRGWGTSGNAQLSLVKKEKHPAIEKIIKEVKMKSQTAYGTRSPLEYSYEFLFKSPANLWSYQVGRVVMHDTRGGDFNPMLRADFTRNDANVQLFAKELEGKDAVMALFSLDQFLAHPLSRGVWDQECVYSFLRSLHAVTKGKDKPIVIVINHCVANGNSRFEDMQKVDKLLQGWISEIFKDFPTKFVPQFYFVDSVAAILDNRDWKQNLPLPLLDLMTHYLTSGTSAPQRNTTIWGDVEQARADCNVFIRNIINMGGQLWQN